ncbi:hypothetical protein [Candidatus Mycoplasma haematobovis]|nr:hypothetical protein [Candidatus Mycoplasma haematobovis]
MTTFAKASSAILVGSGIAGGGTIYWLNSNSSTPQLLRPVVL